MRLVLHTHPKPTGSLLFEIFHESPFSGFMMFSSFSAMCRLTSGLRWSSWREVMKRLAITALRSLQVNSATQNQTASSDPQTDRESSCSSSSGNTTTL